jgi:LacI family transcriptional regulator
MMDKHPAVSQSEIAKIAGVSPSTVSLVLSGRGDEMRISRATQDKVRLVAGQLSYLPNIYARRLRKTGVGAFLQSVGVLWYSGYPDEIMGRFFKGAFEAVNNRQVELSVLIYEADHLFRHQELLQSDFYNGIIINGASDNDVEFLRGIKPVVPVVLSGHSIDTLNCTYVDNYALGRRCARLLHGHHHTGVGIIGYGRKTSGGSLRLTGFLDQCKDLGLRVDQRWCIPSDSISVEGGYQAMRALQDAREQPSCLFVMTDVEALGVVLYSMEHHLEHRDGRGILTYGYNSTLLAMAPNISYAGIQVEGMAKQTIKLLEQLQNRPMSAPINQTIMPEIQQGMLMPPFS